METIGEIIPFAKEMLTQRPSLSMLKLYMLGSTLVVLGVVGGLVETVLLPFGEQETVEDAPGELIMEKEKKPDMTMVSPEEDDVYETELMEAKAKHLVTGRRRSSIRLLGS
ncbi:G0/G1 switch protein 2-like [Notothenia coriiceps]|uniref:G0/G1 switch protein 2-like n=1 Tax=Notothenia coriiceps TaxID=8208 RepID=A0A6I9PSK5_9TELE|nr:PREDICTED: G0/G1 switch protein 2-like [Notothenia coriiceps]